MCQLIDQLGRGQTTLEPENAEKLGQALSMDTRATLRDFVLPIPGVFLTNKKWLGQRV